jgi:hypothetical protein
MSGLVHKSYLFTLACCVLFLVYVYGVIASIFHLYPADEIRITAVNAFGHLTYLKERITDSKNQYTSTMWFDDDSTPSGAIVHDADAIQPGYTLVSKNKTAAVLMDQHGRILHEWKYDFATAFSEADYDPFPQQPDMLHWHCTWVYPNGDLLANHDYVNHYPYGYGLVKLDRDSNVLWTYTGTAHHDFDIDANGNIHTLIQETGMEKIGNINPPYIEDFAVVVDGKTGREISRFSLFQALRNSPYKHMFEEWQTTKHSEVTHTNAIRIVSETWAQNANIPRVKAGDLLISLRNPNAFIIVDPQSQIVRWYGEGIWKQQHDPDLLDNGRVLLFDNQGLPDSPYGHSRVLEVDLFTHEIYWQYKGTDEDSYFDSLIRGAQHRLPNGNTLITESQGGRLLEVTREQKIVWEYYNPDRAEYEGKHLRAMMTQAQRIPTDAVPFLNN